jgi:tRNA ligase
MKPEWGREEALRETLEALVKIVPGLEMPSEEQQREAVEVAMRWEPQTKKVVSEEQLEKKKKKSNAARYYGIAVELDLKALMKRTLPDDATRDDGLFSTLALENRIEKNPHVTLVHEVELKSEDETLRTKKQEAWDRYAGMVKEAEKVGSDSLIVEVSMGPRIVWDSRAMAIEVSGLKSASSGSPESGSRSNRIELAGEGRSAHVTVGTKAQEIRPVEGKFLLEAALRGEKQTKEGGAIHVWEMGIVKCRGRLMGLR